MTDYNSERNRAVWVDIPVADLDRSAAFYHAVLGVEILPQQFGDMRFCVIAHQEGNGGCLVIKPQEISSTGGLLVYLNVDGRIRDATAQVVPHGGKVLEPVQSIGPHGFRAVVLDSEGNRIGLHSRTDG
jgi:uncharacterized protein